MYVGVEPCLRINRKNDLFVIQSFYSKGGFLGLEDAAMYGFQFRGLTGIHSWIFDAGLLPIMAFCGVGFGSFRAALQFSFNTVLFTLPLLLQPVLPNFFSPSLLFCVGFLKLGISMWKNRILGGDKGRHQSEAGTYEYDPADENAHGFLLWSFRNKQLEALQKMLSSKLRADDLRSGRMPVFTLRVKGFS